MAFPATQNDNANTSLNQSSPAAPRSPKEISPQPAKGQTADDRPGTDLPSDDAVIKRAQDNAGASNGAPQRGADR